MLIVLIQAIQMLSLILIAIVLVDVVLSFFMDPMHPLRRTLDRIVEPMLNPIRRVIPPLGGMDFSPVVLVVVIQLVEAILIRLLASLI
jgi:YggT family protein